MKESVKKRKYVFVPAVVHPERVIVPLMVKAESAANYYPESFETREQCEAHIKEKWMKSGIEPKTKEK